MRLLRQSPFVPVTIHQGKSAFLGNRLFSQESTGMRRERMPVGGHLFVSLPTRACWGDEPFWSESMLDPEGARLPAGHPAPCALVCLLSQLSPGRQPPSGWPGNLNARLASVYPTSPVRTRGRKRGVHGLRRKPESGGAAGSASRFDGRGVRVPTALQGTGSSLPPNYGVQSWGSRRCSNAAMTGWDHPTDASPRAPSPRYPRLPH